MNGCNLELRSTELTTVVALYCQTCKMTLHSYAYDLEGAVRLQSVLEVAEIHLRLGDPLARLCHCDGPPPHAYDPRWCPDARRM